MNGQRRYEFGSATEDDTLVAGLRATQLAIVTVGLAAAVVTLRAVTSPVGLAAAAGIAAAAATVAFWQVAGRTPEQWAPVAARWVWRRAFRPATRLSQVPLAGETAEGSRPAAPPPTLAGVEIVAAPVADGGQQVGVVRDRRAGTWGAVMAVRGRSMKLVDTPERQRRLAAWGGVLAGLARASSPIHRIQWVERTVPEDGDAMGRYLATAVTAPAGSASLASYLELVDRAAPTTPTHETFLVVTISAVKARRAIRQAGGGDLGATTVLLRELSTLRRARSGAASRPRSTKSTRRLAPRPPTRASAPCSSCSSRPMRVRR